MADQLPLTDSLQESVLTVLALDDSCGGVIAGQVGPEHFDGQYRDLSRMILRYWRKYRKAPGASHIEDLLSELPGGKDGRSTARRILGRLTVAAASLNSEYVLRRVSEHVRSQTLKAAIGEATDRFLEGQEEGLVEDVESILQGALRTRQQAMDSGTFFGDDDRALRFLDRREEAYPLGIPVLDRQNIGPTPGRLLLYIASKGSGKSWFCVHCSRMALIHRAKVLHVSLEMEEPEVLQRYHQSFFGAATQGGYVPQTVFELDELEQVRAFRVERRKPRITFSDPEVRKWIRERRSRWGTRLNRLVIKDFPSGTLTISLLDSYLDYLESAHKFVPNVLVVDYPDLMKVRGGNNYRLDLGQIFIDLRGLGQRRRMAVIAPTQGNRETLTSAQIRPDRVAEDVSKLFTADDVFMYAQTEAEERLNLARLAVPYARNARRGQVILMSQSYATGQYVVNSTWMRSEYQDQIGGQGARTDS